MTWFTLITGAIQLLLTFMKWKERDQIVSEVQAVERAKALLAIQASLKEASRISSEVSQMTEKELDEHVQNKGWYRD